MGILIKSLGLSHIKNYFFKYVSNANNKIPKPIIKDNASNTVILPTSFTE